MEINFNGRRVLVTGIGRCCVKTLVKCGAKVVALSRTQSDLDSLKQEFSDIETICLDLRDWKKTRDAIEGALPIDLLVNNAALIKPDGPLLNVTEQSFDEIMNVNVKSVINVTQVVAKNLIDRKIPGSIVNISSIGSIRGFDLKVDSYIMSKAALDAMTRLGAVQFGPHGIRVNSIIAGTTLTRFVLDHVLTATPEIQTMFDDQLKRTPTGRFADEQDIVDMIVYLLSDRSKMVNGQSIPVDGGFTIA
ncbi:L-xylulose reductase-like isoform X2 [Tubulanus polymorphus]|uniref:L-xylulose reductase-like isoform X2 n=1 Tax=Tubulanus polymorphus TaxID=672921 RepID=UPI003DA4FCE7